MKFNCRDCKKYEDCPCGKDGHESGTSQGYSIGECKDFKPQKARTGMSFELNFTNDWEKIRELHKKLDRLYCFGARYKSLYLQAYGDSEYSPLKDHDLVRRMFNPKTNIDETMNDLAGFYNQIIFDYVVDSKEDEEDKSEI